MQKVHACFSVKQIAGPLPPDQRDAWRYYELRPIRRTRRLLFYQVSPNRRRRTSAAATECPLAAGYNIYVYTSTYERTKKTPTTTTLNAPSPD